MLQVPDDPASIMNLVSNLQNIAWENLYVTTFIDTNTVVLAAKIAQQGVNANFTFAQDVLQYINLLADLIDEYETLDNAAPLLVTAPFSDPAPSVQALRRVLFPEVDEGQAQGRAILKTFLWTAWQRSVMIYFYYILQIQLIHGYSLEWSSLFAVQGIERLSHLDSHDYRGDGIDYMCNWAFEILRTSRSSLGLDFRTMLSRFDSHFAGRAGRCIKGSDLTCQGNVPESCERFTGAEAKSQFAHMSTCDGFCKKIAWSEYSYIEIDGARGVHLDNKSNSLQYCQASSSTMAISHVWSHGHGGRPEQGINLCLHEQYSSLAKSSNCESYWIDAACIPSDPQLRKEAIKTINTVFTISKVVLIIDKDIQSVDLSTPCIETLETLLSILLVSDWNVRAWTMLEAIRGRKNVHLLGKSGRLMSLLELFWKVMNEGAIDLGILLGSAQHLLLSSDPHAPICVEDAAFLLSQRHASRITDEVVIWGLLSNLPGDPSPLKLWRSQPCVRTGFLISSAPRIEVPGYRWAPQSPYIRPQLRTVSLSNYLVPGVHQHYMVCYQSYDGQDSYVARNTGSGLEGRWLVRDVDWTVLAMYRDDFCLKTPLGDGHPTQQQFNPDLDPTIEVYEQPDTANACNLIENLISAHNRVRVVRPLTTSGTEPYRGGRKRGERYGMVAAVCALGPSDETWEWKGVYQWLDEIEHLTWRIEPMVIV
ncbi:hypothetical protein NA56DRAFT_357969 [Hyaloscypha hepaticicola]|uniref:Heterokaryon incompatibility domain-containing protein n=1 Tax=Hyaloscypha hepaticicola TaxID=2082293 RepID=A0A2J6PM16_9HELO|nr:hypothetical protein NA56DRAFT_357969 [Hyaloscypha hepaticicola]